MHLTFHTLLAATLLAVTTAAPVARGQATTAPATQPAAADEFPEHWYYYGRDKPVMTRVRSLERKPAPSLTVESWVGTPRTLETLKGKVVVVDFWGTWCPPCRAAIPGNREMVSDYIERDFAFVGVHSTQGGQRWSKDAAVQHDVNYPVGVDVENQTARRWNVSFWPTYAVIDHTGIVRAIGLKPGFVRPVVEKLLAEAATPGGAAPARPDAANVADYGDIPGQWLEGPGGRRRQLAPLIALDHAPPIASDAWLSGGPLDPETLRGRVVLVDFWAPWSPPALRGLAVLKRLHETHGDEGLVVIGVCAERGAERAVEVIAEHEVCFPVCVDSGGKLQRRYRVSEYPDYYLIDRAGRVRIADCKEQFLEDAVRKLLAEEAPE